MNLAAEICYQLSRQRVLSRQLGEAGANPLSFNRLDYQTWRQKELEGQYEQHFPSQALGGKDVLDFGCGGGELSFFAAKSRATSVTGFDVSREQYEIALENSRNFDTGPAPTFVHSDGLDTIPFPDESFDIILCFDVLEHILAYRPIIGEWRRVLRAGGRVLIWWVPYYHPYGHHVESLVPLPWVHALFSDKAIIKACAKIYDMPEFEPRVWDLDETGLKKPNKWYDLKTLPTLNKLTIREFEKTARDRGFTIKRREFHPISSSKAAQKVSAFLTQLPVTREFFTACTVYELGI